MSKNKKRRKKQPAIVKLKPKNYIQKAARKLPIYECRIQEEWQDTGLTVVTVARQKSNGSILLGGYIVDVWCLGLKDTYYEDNLTEQEYEERIEQIFSPEFNIITCEPALVFNVIYGAIEFAEDIGFKPHPDFSVTEYILDDVSEVPFIDLEFGQDGKPFYISGPHDQPEKVLKILEKNLGPGNYDFLAELSDDDYQES